MLTDFSFGTVTMLLQLVPVLSMFFLMTSAAGSALWVADIEQRRSLLASQNDQSVNDGYHDSADP